MNLDWIKTIPDFISYFNDDHRIVIELIGIDNYFLLYDYFGKTGIYFSGFSANNDQHKVIELIGDENYYKIYSKFGKAGIYFSTVSIHKLKRAWAVKNRHVDYNEAARILDVAAKTIYRWREDACSQLKSTG
jgi:hypothetical protein